MIFGIRPHADWTILQPSTEDSYKYNRIKITTCPGRGPVKFDLYLRRGLPVEELIIESCLG